MNPIFHLALNVDDLNIARDFYGKKLGCSEGRSTNTWVDFDFFGHQLSLHLGPRLVTHNCGRVGEHIVPIPHFGILLDNISWLTLSDRLRAENTTFIVEPVLRFAGQIGEQYTMFFEDPFGNPIEVKGFESAEGIFEK